MFIINKPNKDLFYSMDKIGFEVKVIKNPLNANHVLKVINSYVCRGDQLECNAFGAAFMSHGGKNGAMETWEDTIRVEQIINGVKGQNALTGKPKLFIFQGKILFTFTFV